MLSVAGELLPLAFFMDPHESMLGRLFTWYAHVGRELLFFFGRELLLFFFTHLVFLMIFFSHLFPSLTFKALQRAGIAYPACFEDFLVCSCTASHLPRCTTPFGMFGFVCFLAIFLFATSNLEHIWISIGICRKSAHL